MSTWSASLSVCHRFVLGAIVTSLSVCLSVHMSACILCLCSQDLTNIDLFLASREVEEALQQKETLNCLPVSACLPACMPACI